VGLSAESKDCPTQADGCTSKTFTVNIPEEKGARACALTCSPHRFFLCFDIMNTLNSLKVCLDNVSVFLFIQSENDEVVLSVLYTRSCLAVNTTFPFFVIIQFDFLKQNALVFILLPLDGYFIVILYMEGS